MIKRKIFINSTLLLFFLISYNCFSQTDLVQIRPFGSNPGNLKLLLFEPDSVKSKLPLVIVLHGCTQTAKVCAEQTGWNKLAAKHKFYVLYPEQIILNNAENCFNWYRQNDQEKGKGEPESIKQMIDYLKQNKQIDSSKIFIIGLSAGGAMSSIMLSIYPEVFNKGGVMSGGPYKSAESVIKAGPSMLGMVSKSPEDWGDLVRKQNPHYNGKYPELIVFHGGIDPIVSSNNANQLIKQWVNIHNTDYEEDEHFAQFNNNEDVELTIYKDKSGKDVVHYFRIKGMGHAVSLDTGACSKQGGKTGMFAIDNNFHSTYWAAHFFGLINSPYTISGKTSVKANETNLTYSVPNTSGSLFKWNTPGGFWINEGLNTNSINLSVHYKSGLLQVTETTKEGCELEPAKIWVNVSE